MAEVWWESKLFPYFRCRIPVDLEHERAAVCARQRGHGAPMAGRPLGSRGAGSWGPGRRRAAAAHAERDASLICQSRLETSAFPPSALKSPKGREAQPRRGACEPSHRRPAWHARSGGRRGCGHTAGLPSGCCDRRRALPGALTSGRRERGRLTRRPLSEAGNSICPKLRSCQGMWARGGNPRLPPAPTESARSGNQRRRNSLP